MIKFLVIAKIYCFDQISVYPKLVVFFPTCCLLKGKCFLKFVFITDNVCPLEVLFMTYKFSGQCFGQSI